MPELPEVETIRKGLEPCLTGKRIESVSVRRARSVQGATQRQFAARLRGATFLRFGRHGKFMLLHLDNGLTLIVDLRMTGQLVYESPDSPLPRHTHIVFRLSDGARLRFTDSRTFGSIKLVETDHCHDHPCLRRLGPDALSNTITLKTIAAMLNRTSRPMKLFLLDQQRLAGIGNIYASEILFQAGIHPDAPAHGLTDTQIRKLCAAIRLILTIAISRCGTTMSDFRTATGGYGTYQNEFRVYGREGQPCLRCNTLIFKTRHGGRATYLCPRCQSLP